VVRQKVADGRFASADEVVAAAVRLLDTRDQYEYLRGLILAAEQEFQDGKIVEWTPELHRQWRLEAEERAHEELPPDPDAWP
jgi:Arc/MetJ-type ribon-helix-helix transcriptional regulator